MMKLKYKFSEDERRVVAQANAQYMQVVRVIADLHQLQGQLSLAPDLTGFVEQEQNVQDN